MWIDNESNDPNGPTWVDPFWVRAIRVRTVSGMARAGVRSTVEALLPEEGWLTITWRDDRDAAVRVAADLAEATKHTFRAHPTTDVEVTGEVEQLRRWKAEALEVLGQWEICYDLLEAVGYRAPLGRSKAVYVADWIRERIPGPRPE